jgi:4a-hydroxytetrahydrobiopterin dehydratase
MSELNPDQVKSTLPSVKEWRKNAAMISRTFQFKDFVAAMDFVNKVAKVAEEDNHHPDIDIRWNKVTLHLTTHSAGGLTENDFNLARKIDRLL